MIKEDIELMKLRLHIDNILKKSMYEDKYIDCCPSCGSSYYIKYGSYKGIQRYKCKDCGKTFSKSTNSLFSYSKHSPSKWIEFIELMLEKKSLRFCAAKLEINLATAFYWRHKILHGLSLEPLKNKLNGNVYIGKAFIKENFKGCRNINTSIRDKIWVIGAKGIEDSMLVNPISTRFWSSKNFNEKIYTKIEKKSYIIPYTDNNIYLVAKSHNNNLIKKTTDENKIKLLGLNLNKWLKCFHGIATKYLEKYLSLFILFNLDKKIDYMDITPYLSFGNRFIKINEIGLV